MIDYMKMKNWTIGTKLVKLGFSGPISYLVLKVLLMLAVLSEKSIVL